MGKAAARNFGLPEVPTEVEDSVDGLVAKVRTICLLYCRVFAKAHGLHSSSSITLPARRHRVNFYPLMKLHLCGSILL